MTTPTKSTDVKAKPAKTTVAKTDSKVAPAKKAPVAKTKPVAAPKTKPVAEPIEAAIEANTETVTKIVETGTEVAKQSVEKAAEASQEQIATAAKVSQEQITTAAKVSADTFKGYEDFIALSKENIEAFVQTNAIYSKGVQEINETVLMLVQGNVAQTVDYTQKILSCAAIDEVFSVQQEMATVQYSKTVEDSKLISEMTVALAEKASKPISERVNVTIETLTKPIAA